MLHHVVLSRSDMQIYHWLFREYEPLHAFVMLLSDLFQRPLRESAARNRESLDLTFMDLEKVQVSRASDRLSPLREKAGVQTNTDNFLMETPQDCKFCWGGKLAGL